LPFSVSATQRLAEPRCSPSPTAGSGIGMRGWQRTRSRSSLSSDVSSAIERASHDSSRQVLTVGATCGCVRLACARYARGWLLNRYGSFGSENPKIGAVFRDLAAFFTRGARQRCSPRMSSGYRAAGAAMSIWRGPGLSPAAEVAASSPHPYG
jgi:hypothetical protein